MPPVIARDLKGLDKDDLKDIREPLAPTLPLNNFVAFI